MKIGLLFNDAHSLAKFEDIASDYGAVDCYTEVNNFIAGSEKYDFLIMDHQPGNKSWINVYTKMPTVKPVLILSTYDLMYYKREWPETYYRDIEPILTLSNVYHSKKDDDSLIKFYCELVLSRVDCRNICTELTNRK